MNQFTPEQEARIREIVLEIIQDLLAEVGDEVSRPHQDASVQEEDQSQPE